MAKTKRFALPVVLSIKIAQAFVTAQIEDNQIWQKRTGSTCVLGRVYKAGIKADMEAQCLDISCHSKAIS